MKKDEIYPSFIKIIPKALGRNRGTERRAKFLRLRRKAFLYYLYTGDERVGNILTLVESANLRRKVIFSYSNEKIKTENYA